MLQDDLIGSVDLVVPYRKIDHLSFHLLSISKLNSQSIFEIQFQAKYQGLNKADHPSTVKRTFSDFYWLISTTIKHYDHFLILPSLLQSQKGFASSIISTLLAPTSKDTNSISKDVNSTSKDINESDPSRNYQQIVVNRFLKIISQISLNYMYQKLGDFKCPFFIFVQNDHNYKFYRSLYDQENKPQEGLLSGYLNTVLELIPNFSKKVTVESYGLENMVEKMVGLQEKGAKLMQRLKGYKGELDIISDNFINKKSREELKMKKERVEEYLNRLQENMKYGQLVLKELRSNLDRLIEKKEKGEEQYIEQMVRKYLEGIEEERKEINGNIQNIGREFIEGSSRDVDRVVIEIGQIYSNYDKVT